MKNIDLFKLALSALNSCDWDYDGEENPYKTFDENLVNLAAKELHIAISMLQKENEKTIHD